MNSKEIKIYILEKNKTVLLESKAENIACSVINEKYTSRWIKNPNFKLRLGISTEYDFLGRMYPSDCLQDTSYDLFIDDLITELAKQNRVSPYDFDRILQCGDITLAQTIWEILKENNFLSILQSWYDE